MSRGVRGVVGVSSVGELPVSIHLTGNGCLLSWSIARGLYGVRTVLLIIPSVTCSQDCSSNPMIGYIDTRYCSTLTIDPWL